MKKIFIGLLCGIICAAGLYAENMKFKVEGPEDSYNKVRIINNTKNTNFACKVYLLEEQDSKFMIKETIGTCHLKGFGDTDSCSCKLLRNSYIGVSIPEGFAVFSRISYRDYPFYDIVEIYLSDTESIGTVEEPQIDYTETEELPAGLEF